MTELDFNSAAIIVWMPEGDEPCLEDYQGEDGTAPETEGHWLLSVAIVVALLGPAREGKKPWVKVGNDLLSPDQLQPAYEAMKRGRDYSV